MAHEFDGKKYEKSSAHQKEWGAKLIRELGLKGTERVLDLGCGDGTLTVQLAELLPEGEVIGIDASQGMIDTAFPKATRNVRFLLKDINTLAFNKEFDVVISNATLHWVKDHSRLLKNVHHALRPGGYLRFNFAGDGNCSHFFKVIREAMVLDAFAAHFSQFEWPWYMPAVDDYLSLVEKMGLHNARVWGENADRYFPDEETMIGWIDQPSLVPFLAHIPAQDKDAFHTFVVQRMREETRQDDGRCFETFRRINVSAMK
ncbi:MAG: methyltransferase domain-containing protein [Proteobacteria bacterium]|nr:methyltransferase domain-containing protein [Desulfobulbaceae bacterium]MBU4152293.1 methyltransferase domain-containing protein [Pseudomonadota bacterium]